MEKSTLTRIGIFMILLLVIVSSLAQADVYMKQKRHSDGMKVMGQQKPAEDVVEKIWITDKGFRSDNPQSSMIMLLDKKVMIMINHKEKSYTEMPMNMGDMMSKKSKDMDAEDRAAFQKMMKGMMKMEVSVQPTGEKKKIKGWNCKKYIMTLTTFMGPFSNEIWATEDLKMDMDLYAKFSSSMMAAMPGMKNAADQMMKEMKKIKGVQVLNISTMNIMNQTTKSTTELLDFKKGKAPSGIFIVPSGYKKKSITE